MDRTPYVAPVFVKLGGFRENTGYLGIKNRESLTYNPRSFW